MRERYVKTPKRERLMQESLRAVEKKVGEEPDHHAAGHVEADVHAVVVVDIENGQAGDAQGGQAVEHAAVDR